MQKDKLFSKIVEIIEEAKPELKGNIKETSTFREELQMDSLDMISVLFEFEEAFDVKIPEEAISEKELISVERMIDYISGELKKS